MERYLVLDIGGSSIKYSLMTEAIEFIEKGKIPTPLDSINSFVNVIGKLYDKYKDDIKGLAISMPGLLDSKRGYAYTGGLLTYNDDKFIVEILKKRCPIKITIENDAKCAALAELWKGSLKGYDDAIVIVLGSGVGGAIVKDGKLHRGKNFFAGEFSFMWVDGNITNHDFSNWFGFKNGAASLNGEVAKIKKLPVEEVDGLTVFKYINDGDKEALEVLENFTDKLAVQIYNLQCVYDSEVVAIGGGISEQDKLIEYIENSVNKIFDDVPFKIPRAKIVRCKFRNDANLIGALYNFLGLEEQ